jgi:hypothetical protein
MVMVLIVVHFGLVFFSNFGRTEGGVDPNLVLPHFIIGKKNGALCIKNGRGWQS